jgi:hypothetical protein
MILRDLEDIYLRKMSINRNDLSYLMSAIASPDNINEQRAYWKTALQGYQPSLVEPSTTPQTTLRRLLNAGELVKHVQAPLLLSLGVLQAATIARQRLSPTAHFIAGILAVTGTYLLALPLVQHSDAGNTIQNMRTYCVIRDLVFGFSALQRLSMEQNLPLHMVLLACWAKVQAKRSKRGKHGVVFGLGHNGRRLDGTDDIAAPCINVLPVYVPSPLGSDAFAVAMALHADLRSRSAVVEQSRLQDVSSWVGAPGKPLFHYFINMLKVPSGNGYGKPSTSILERIKVGTLSLKGPETGPNYTILSIKVSPSPVATRNIEPNAFGGSSNLSMPAMQEVQVSD